MSEPTDMPEAAFDDDGFDEELFRANLALGYWDSDLPIRERDMAHVARQLLEALDEARGQAIADTQARKLVEDAYFLRVNGERPPGAPRDNPAAETWPEWDHRAGNYLQALVNPPTSPILTLVAEIPFDQGPKCVHCDTGVLDRDHWHDGYCRNCHKFSPVTLRATDA